MSYGIPYQGSKSKIAPWVVSNLPAAPVLVDLFAGGCAVTHAALASGRFGRVVANDLLEGPEVFLRACLGDVPDPADVPTREEFNARKDEDFATALLYSFGNNRRDYLWSPAVEAVKVPATRMVCGHTIEARKAAYNEFLRALRGFLESEGRMPDASPAQDGGLEGLQRLQRLQRLQGLQGLQGLETSRLDYRDVPVPEGACVYADPPYRGTNCRAYGGAFDFGAFDGWLAGAPFMVVVSEYTAPPGCVEVARCETRATMAASGKNQRHVERLFVQGRFAAEWRERMGMLELGVGEGTAAGRAGL